jgi:hypothetical protein
VLGWKLAPGRDVRHRTRYFDVRYSTNSLGFRDRERSALPPKDTRRILLLGDSQIMGWGVGNTEHIAALLEAPGREVWNLGVPGYGLDQELLSYRKLADSSGATDVVIFISRAVIRRINFNSRYNKPKPRFVLDSAGGLRLEPVDSRQLSGTGVLLRVLGAFYLPYFLDLQLLRLQSRRIPGSGNENDDVALDGPTTRLTLALIEEARRTAAARGHRLVILASLTDSANLIRDYSRRSGVGFVTTPWIIPPRNLIHGRFDSHWVPAAHRMIADRLRSWLDSSAVMTDTISPSVR